MPKRMPFARTALASSPTISRALVQSLRFGLVIALGLSAPAYAQAPMTVTAEDYRWLADISVGPALQAPRDVNQSPTCDMLLLPCLSPRTAGDIGAALTGTVYPDDAIGIVGEASIYANRWFSQTPNCDPRHSVCATSQINNVRAAMAGLRLRTPLINGGTARGRFFAQVLAGNQWSDVEPRQKVFQAGGGYEGYSRVGIGYRVQIDYRFSPDAAGRDLSTTRVFAGLLIPLGSQ